MTTDFDERLKAMKARYLENFPQDEAAQEAKIRAFKALSQPEKEAKIQETLQLLSEKKQLLMDKGAQTTEAAEKAELAEHIEALVEKIHHFEEKLAIIRSNESDSVKKERLKRQLAQLELKRCKSQLDKKNCNKIEQKIAHKKEIFKKIFSTP